MSPALSFVSFYVATSAIASLSLRALSPTTPTMTMFLTCFVIGAFVAAMREGLYGEPHRKFVDLSKIIVVMGGLSVIMNLIITAGIVVGLAVLLDGQWPLPNSWHWLLPIQGVLGAFCVAACCIGFVAGQTISGFRGEDPAFEA